MFQINDTVIYGSHGVCKISEIGTLSLSMADNKKQYYTLRPVYHPTSVIYAPVENPKTLMRSVISKEDAEKLIREVPDIDSVWIANEKERESQYKAALQTCDCRELVKIIKTLYLRKTARIQTGKKVTAVDEKYFRMAESALYEELAYALDMEKSMIAPYISEHVIQKD